MRHSLAPISFPKSKRFRNVPLAGAQAPFYETASSFKLHSFKQGFGFGHAPQRQAKVAERTPSPQDYHRAELSQFTQKRIRNRCFFGVSFEDTRQCDIDNRALNHKERFEKVGPLSYNPSPRLARKSPLVITMKGRYPRAEEI